MTTTILDALGRLSAALDHLGRALQTGETDQVLQAEAPLAEAVHGLATLPQRGRVDAAPLRDSLIAARVSLLRCRALGSCAAEFADAISQSAYGSTGMRLRSENRAAYVTSRT